MNPMISRVDPDKFADWQGLLVLILEAFAYMDQRIDPPSSAHRLTLAGLREKARTETCFIAKEDEQLLGCVFCKAETGALYIGKLAIAPDTQGKGVGRRLLEAAEEHAKASGLWALRLETRIELTENHAIFSKWGFVKTAENAHPGYNRPTSIEMRKSLTTVPNGSESQQ